MDKIVIKENNFWEDIKILRKKMASMDDFHIFELYKEVKSIEDERATEKERKKMLKTGRELEHEDSDLTPEIIKEYEEDHKAIVEELYNSPKEYLLEKREEWKNCNAVYGGARKDMTPNFDTWYYIMSFA